MLSDVREHRESSSRSSSPILGPESPAAVLPWRGRETGSDRHSPTPLTHGSSSMANTPTNPTLPAFSIGEWRSFPVNKQMLRSNRVPYASDTHTNFRAAWEAHEAQQRVGEVEAFIHDYLCVPRLGPNEKDLQPELPAFYVGSRTQLLKRLAPSTSGYPRCSGNVASVSSLHLVGFARSCRQGHRCLRSAWS